MCHSELVPSVGFLCCASVYSTTEFIMLDVMHHGMTWTTQRLLADDRMLTHKHFIKPIWGMLCEQIMALLKI